MKPPLKQGSANDFQTPPQALAPVLFYLNRMGIARNTVFYNNWKPAERCEYRKPIIWECAAGKGNLVKEFERLGYPVYGSDVLTGQDFLWWEPEFKYDCIITNPPFALKQQFLERAYKLGKPFAFLLPLTTFESRKRQELFKRYGIEVIMFDKRINFETPDGTGAGSWFATAWFTWGLNIGKQLTFVELER